MNRQPHFFALLFFVLVSCQPAKEAREIPKTLFTDVADEEGVTARQIRLGDIQRVSSGAAWIDFENDGDLDLYVSNVNGPNQLYRNNRIGSGENNFTEIADDVAKALNSHSAGVTVADYDNDGDNDIYLTNLNEDVLLQNDGKGNFKNVTSEAFKTSKQFLFEFGASAAWGDINNDGWLDLYVANNAPDNKTTAFSRDYLFVNDGGNPVTFTDRTDLLAGDFDQDGIEDLDAIGFMGMFTDYNLDGHLDIYVINDCPYGPEDNKLWRNNGDMTFTEVSHQTGPFSRGKFLGGKAINDCHNAMGITCGDPNHDGWPDYHFTNVHYEQQNTVLLLNTGNYLLNASAEAGLDAIEFNSRVGMYYTWGTVFIDYDLDTWQDLALATGSLFGRNDQPNMLFHNDGTDIGGYPKLKKVSDSQSGIANLAQSRTLIQGDYDMDGDPDLFLVNFDSVASIYRNNNHNSNNWLIVEAGGAGPPLSNLNGIGAKVYITTPDHLRQFFEIRSGSTLGGGDDIAAYFGLGDHKSSQIEILWPSGIRQVIDKVPSNQRLKISEPILGITFPKGGEFFTKGETVDLTWKSVSDESVDVILQKQNSDEVIIANGIANKGSFNWQINESIPESQDYRLILKDSKNGSVLGKSNATFTILHSTMAFCQLIYPNGSELLSQGSSCEIKWNTNFMEEKLDINLLIGGETILEIARQTENDGTFEWIVPEGLEGNTFSMEIVCSSSGMRDRSDRPFVLVKQLIEPKIPQSELLKRTSK
mgnify:CR=1 FL=1